MVLVGKWLNLLMASLIIAAFVIPGIFFPPHLLVPVGFHKSCFTSLPAFVLATTQKAYLKYRGRREGGGK